jgi:hypothetical protein
MSTDGRRIQTHSIKRRHFFFCGRKKTRHEGFDGDFLSKGKHTKISNKY